MGRTKKIFTDIRVIIALIAVLLAVFSIYPNPLNQGAAIRSVRYNSSASLAGLESPEATASPMTREVIIEINGKEILDEDDYYNFERELSANRTVRIKTNKADYRLTSKQEYDVITLNETENKTITEEVFDEEKNETVNATKTVEVQKKIYVPKEDIDLGLAVYDAPTSNIRKGLDLQGGTRVLLEPEEKLSEDQMSMLIENMKYRLNVYGVSDVVVRGAGDLSGNQYVLVEIAGAKEEEVKELLSKQGKFEATVGNETVFRGGQDITYVCRSADCSGIDPTSGCGRVQDGYVCRFRFAISLSPEAAERQAKATENLQTVTENGEEYLSEKLGLYLDNALVDELSIGADLKGRPVTDIAISGSGAGRTQQEAALNALENMNSLQTILVTGSLPVKLDIVKTDTISPAFGEEILDNAVLVGLLAILGVALVVYVRYRNYKVAGLMFLNSVIEVVLLLGFASLVGWNLDLAAIAGIIIVVGTGVDSLIVLTDETLAGESQTYNWKDKIKKAFFIIMAAYLTTLSAMLPLWFAGAGLLRGFALTTIAGITFGVLLVRPAYAKAIEILLK